MEDVYYLVKFGVLKPEEDFRTLIGELTTYTGMQVDGAGEEKITVTINGENKPFWVSIVTNQTQFGSENVGVFELRCEQGNMGHMNLVKMAGRRFGYRIYSVKLGSFLPGGQIMPVVSSRIPENGVKAFGLYNLEPLFMHFDEDFIYARDSQGGIHIVNSGLLDYYVHFGIEQAESKEFSYLVAKNLTMFGAMYDQGLVPVSFYEYYQRNIRIMNFSEMNLWKVHRKIFLKPYIFRWDAMQQAFTLMTSDRAALHMADKIRQGENIETAMHRVLKDELLLPTDYLCMRIGRQIEFDRDKGNTLTPRLAVSVFYDSLQKLDPAVNAQTQRGWAPLDKLAN